MQKLPRNFSILMDDNGLVEKEINSLNFDFFIRIPQVLQMFFREIFSK